MSSTIKDFWRITLDTNPDFCNLRCVMCEDHSPYLEYKTRRKLQGSFRPMMNKGLLEKVMREAANLGFSEVIPSTMGEPLIYPYFEDLLQLCSELKMSLNLTTNGTFPSREKLQNVEFWAERIIPIASDVKISWNGAIAETHKKIMKGATLPQHIDNARRFIHVRDQLAEQHYCSLTMQLTFMRANINEIEDMVRLAIDLGFDRIKGHQLWAHFDQLQSESLRRTSELASRWNEVVDGCERIVNEHHSRGGKHFKLDNFVKLNPEQLENIAPGAECPFLGKEIWVDPTGRFNVCCAPDQQRRELGEFGNLNNQTISEIINGNSYSELLSCYQDYPLCIKCNMRRPSSENY